MGRTVTAGRRRGWYHGWNVVAACVVAQIAANGLGINAISLFLQDWSRDLHAPISSLLVSALLLGIGFALVSPVSGVLADKSPARKLFAAGLAGMALFSILMSSVTAVWQVWVLYAVLLPISIVLCTSTASNALVSRWFVRRLGLALGVTALGMQFAGIVLPPLIAAVMPAIGWRAVWRAGGLITALVVLPLVVWVVRDRPSEEEGASYLSGQAHAIAHHAHGRADGIRWADILKRRNYWLLAACYLPIVAMYGSVQQNFAPIAANHGYDPSVAGMLLPAFSLASVAGTVAMGFVSDRWGNRLPLAALGFLSAMGGLLVAFGDSVPLLGLGAVVIGFTSGMWTLLPAAMALEFGAAAVGRAFGALMLLMPLAAAGSAVLARVHESTGSYAPALTGFSAIAVVGGALVLLARENRGGHLTAAEVELALAQPHSPAGP